MSIAVHDISKSFGGFRALYGVSLEVRTGELVALLGPSGCGKTTLLRIIAGLEGQDGGAVLLGGADTANMAVQERRVGLVFQHYALFAHMSVADNIAFGLRARPRGVRPAAAVIESRVRELLALMQLDGLGARLPQQLSGGQRQRVALARALAIEPRVLLLDEPFGALDAQVRRDLRRWLRALHDRLHVTTLFVTHDQDEARELADRMVVMNAGQIEQAGSSGELYEQPASAFVHGFFGQTNRLPGMLRDGAFHLACLGEPLAVPLAGSLGAPAASDAVPADGAAVALVRPHDLIVLPAGQGAEATVLRALAQGLLTRIELQLPRPAAAPLLLEAELLRTEAEVLGLAAGQRVSLRLRRARVYPAA
jgi:sulfate transport system ATP-binding protein